jgi:LemA protein
LDRSVPGTAGGTPAAAAGVAAVASVVGLADSAAAAAAVAVAAPAGRGEIMRRVIRASALMALMVVAASASSGCSYNRFVSEEEAVKAQWAQVDNQLQRRNDLIPNLVETTKGFAQQERDVFQAIADSRAKLAGAQTPEQRIQAANEQSSALARLLVVVENYPQLKSSETFARLMDELAGTIAVERMRYNESVQRYNTSRRQFPGNITASIFGFDEYPLYEVPESARVAPKVDFGRPPSGQ